jgi:hypothetical protein
VLDNAIKVATGCDWSVDETTRIHARHVHALKSLT